jgi:hypothetical protein
LKRNCGNHESNYNEWQVGFYQSKDAIHRNGYLISLWFHYLHVTELHGPLRWPAVDFRHGTLDCGSPSEYSYIEPYRLVFVHYFFGIPSVLPHPIGNLNVRTLLDYDYLDQARTAIKYSGTINIKTMMTYS